MIHGSNITKEEKPWYPSLRVLREVCLPPLSLALPGLTVMASAAEISKSDFVKHLATIDPILPDLIISGGLFAATAATYSLLALAFPTPKDSKHKTMKFSPLWVVPSLFLLIMIVQTLQSSGHEQEEPALIKACLRGAPLMLASMTCSAPVLEEIVFRGLLFRRLMAFGGPLVAYPISSGMFGLAHMSDRADKVLMTASIGAFLCAAYHLTGTIFAPIVLHMAINSTAVLNISSLNPSLSSEQRQRYAYYSMMADLSSKCFTNKVAFWRRDPMFNNGSKPSAFLLALVNEMVKASHSAEVPEGCVNPELVRTVLCLYSEPLFRVASNLMEEHDKHHSRECSESTYWAMFSEKLVPRTHDIRYGSSSPQTQQQFQDYLQDAVHAYIRSGNAMFGSSQPQSVSSSSMTVETFTKLATAEMMADPRKSLKILDRLDPALVEAARRATQSDYNSVTSQT